MKINFGWLLISIILVGCTPNSTDHSDAVRLDIENEQEEDLSQQVYTLELERWNIHNDESHPIETTKGFNEALNWASENGDIIFEVPAGNYLIDKDFRINMVSNMTFKLDDETVLQKETNGYERYELLYIGPGIENVTLIGGIYMGDRDTHDYSGKDNEHSAGTHESGCGILAEGAIGLTVENVKAVSFTGDGLCVGGTSQLINELSESDFKFGGLDENGNLIYDTTKIRTKDIEKTNFTNGIFENQRTFQFSLPRNLSSEVTFDVYFFNAEDIFLSHVTDQKIGWDLIEVPVDADYYYAVFDTDAIEDVYVEFWNKVISKDVTVKNSEFAYNRRQGITVGGAENVLIENNEIHNISGTAPQSGIDVEGGVGENGLPNENIKIRDNNFYNNAAYDVILFDGKNAIVENNYLGSKGAIGLAISEPFSGATVKNNTFDGSRIVAYYDAEFIDNVMNDSYTYFTGPNITIDGMILTDSKFSISSKVPFGVTASNILIKNNKKNDSGLTVWDQPVHLTNITIEGQSTLRNLTGGVEEGSIFDNLKVIGYNSTYGLDLPRGTYNNCVFEAGEGGSVGPVINQEGKYEFNDCTFVGGNPHVANDKADVTIKQVESN
ncbi:right-handed parallel beta-helix repeat-containing protein [Halalkalibacter alkalisediminis]|uniref:Right-handed parallel beta-helix repeat-containing protein n=1 Tax=Halalkalibacter alkalisediminis TaxID=935616 RepID=A0ABV6NIV9_9BACI|nr:right-handed parallel beta-helix repeat-containing protein [Halalkalibacter alkalisediminis]